MTELSAPIALAGGFEPPNYRDLAQARRKGAPRRRLRPQACCAHCRRVADKPALHTRRCACRCSGGGAWRGSVHARDDAAVRGPRLAHPPARRGAGRRHRKRGDPGGARRRGLWRGVANRGPRPDRDRNRGRIRYGRGAGRRLSRLRLRAACRRYRQRRGSAEFSWCARAAQVEAGRSRLVPQRRSDRHARALRHRGHADYAGTWRRHEAGARSARERRQRRCARGRCHGAARSGCQRGAGACPPRRDAYRLPARLRGRRRLSERRIFSDRLRACRRYGLVPRRRQAARRAHDHRAHRGRLQSARPARCTSRRSRLSA